MRYIVRRIGYSLLVLLAVSVATFALVEAAPGDFFDELRQNPRIAPETVESLRRQYGFAEPPLARYVHWVRSVARGEFGYSLAYQTDVASLLRVPVRNTLLLAVPALLVAWGVALAAGVWCAAHRGGLADRVSAALSSALLTIPEPVFALLCLVLALSTGWFPIGGMTSAVQPGDRSLAQLAADVAAHAVLPIGALSLGVLPIIFRHVRAGMVEVLDAFTLRAARGHGIGPARLLWRYAIPLAANPLVSLAGLTVGLLLSGSLLIEVVMGWPGLGPMLLDAILARDRHVVIGAAMLSTVFLVAGSLVADLTLFALDPRIRAR